MAAATAEKSRGSNKSLVHAAIVVVVGVIATTLAQTQMMGRIPLQNLLKNELHVDRATNAAFFFWIGLAWYFKPLAGIVTDAFPLFGSRRKNYMLISTVLASCRGLGSISRPTSTTSSCGSASLSTFSWW